MYSLPTRTTLAVFTIASAGSTAPMRPLVSIIPSASKGIISEQRPTIRLSDTANDALRLGVGRAREIPHSTNRFVHNDRVLAPETQTLSESGILESPAFLSPRPIPAQPSPKPCCERVH